MANNTRKNSSLEVKLVQEDWPKVQESIIAKFKSQLTADEMVREFRLYTNIAKHMIANRKVEAKKAQQLFSEIVGGIQKVYVDTQSIYFGAAYLDCEGIFEETFGGK